MKLLHELSHQDIDFQLILLGERGRVCEQLDEIQQQYSETIIHNGYAESRERYEELLSQMDLVVSTADHEFFGIALCEAIWCGAIPLTPNALSYTEYVPDSLRYDSIDHAVEIIRNMTPSQRRQLLHKSQNNIRRYQLSKTTANIDTLLESLTG